MHVFFQMLLQFRYSSVVFLRGNGCRMCQQPAPLQILYMFIYTHKWELMKSVGATDGSNLSLLLFMREATMGLDNSAMKLN